MWVNKGEFERQRLKLKSYYIRLRAGLIAWNTIPKYYQGLLKKYYKTNKEEDRT